MEETWIQKEELVYALDNPVFDNALIDAHNLIRTTQCRPIWNHDFQPDRNIKQNINCETLLWFLTHHIMRMISYARHDVGGFLIASFPGVVHWSHCRTWCMQWFTCWYPLYSKVWLIAQHIMHISSSAWHCMCTSCTFLRVGKHHTMIVFHTQNMMMIVFWV